MEAAVERELKEQAGVVTPEKEDGAWTRWRQGNKHERDACNGVGRWVSRTWR